MEARYDTSRHLTDRVDRTEHRPRPAIRVDDDAAASPAPRRDLSPSEALHLAERGRRPADRTEPTHRAGADRTDADEADSTAPSVTEGVAEDPGERARDRTD